MVLQPPFWKLQFKIVLCGGQLICDKTSNFFVCVCVCVCEILEAISFHNAINYHRLPYFEGHDITLPQFFSSQYDLDMRKY